MSAPQQQNISIVTPNGEKKDLQNASWIQVNFADSSQRTILIKEMNTPFTGNYQQIQMNFMNELKKNIDSFERYHSINQKKNK